ncbi:MAG: carbohydrate-binding domain-containing protein [Clostridia bacterium]|nr:carbohydrate-binding domain-containing protein [Clostridia bacterium]
MKRILALMITLTLVLTACGGTGNADTTAASTTAASTTAATTAESSMTTAALPSGEEIPADAVRISLSDDAITVDGAAISDDPGADVYTARDIVYYEAGHDFTYGEGTAADEHTADEAAAHTVVHITAPGTYALSGTLSAGQIAVDLGEDADEDPDAVVTLILDGVDITCTVAPGVIFYNVYECGDDDEDDARMDVDTSAAGANVIIADGSVNTVNGSYVARIYKSIELSEDGKSVVDSKKLHKYDAAFYSKRTMNVTGGAAGTGVLNINAENEGLDTELHLTINGGNINIVAGNDGINTNEDYVSVTTVNAGSLNIVCDGATGEGDGIDSNGWLVINGGSVTTAACATSGDAGIDADNGIYINGGTIAASGNMFDRIAGGSATYAVLSFAGRQSSGSTYTLKNASGETTAQWTPVNDFTYLVVAGDMIVPGTYTLWQGETQLAGVSSSGGMNMMPGGFGGGNFEAMPMPEGGFKDGERPEMPEGGFDAMPVPEFGGGELPEGFKKNEDGTVTMPDGSTLDPSQMPDRGFGGGRMPEGGFRGQPGQGSGEQMPVSMEFVIADGGNYFTGITTVPAGQNI